MRRWTRECPEVPAECRAVVHVRAEPGVGVLRVSLSDGSSRPLPGFDTLLLIGASPVMAIEVRVPTILRSYPGGAKVVEGSGDTLAGLIDDLDARHNGLRGRLITAEGGLHRFVNIYVNDEDVRFLGALDAKVADGDSVTILPAVAGGALGFAAVAALLGR